MYPPFIHRNWDYAWISYSGAPTLAPSTLERQEPRASVVGVSGAFGGRCPRDLLAKRVFAARGMCHS